MKICIIAEGSYPYVTGGVSSWIQMLITKLPEFEFVIHSIGANEKDKGKFKYTLPPNLSRVNEMFLESALKEVGKGGKIYGFTKEEREALTNLLSGNRFDWNSIFLLIKGTKITKISDFLMSRDFFDVIKDVYAIKYSHTSFNDFFWTARSLLIPLFYILKQGVEKADIYHSVSTGYAGVLGAYASFLYNKPFILTEHGIYTREREEEIIKSSFFSGDFKNIWIEYFYSLSQCAYDKAEKVITLFRKSMEIEIDLGCDKDKIQIIPNGVDIQKIREARKINNISNFEKKETISLGAIVRIVAIKDIVTMIQAFAMVREEMENCILYIMGPPDEDSKYMEECVNLIKSNNIEGIIFTGLVDILKMVPQMDILLLTSISEGQPLAVLEGMAFSKPYITTDVGSCRELLIDDIESLGEAGIVVPLMDSKKICEAILLLARNKDLRQQMGKNAFERVSKQYTLEKFIDSYRNIYEEMR